MLFGNRINYRCRGVILHFGRVERSMSGQDFEGAVCSFCARLSKSKGLLASIMLRLKKEKNHYHDRHFPLVLEEERQGFKQLLTIVFSHEIRPDSQCEHLQLYKFMLKKLKCSLQYFNFLCEKVAAAVGERNYQLQVLASQVKNVASAIQQQTVEPIRFGGENRGEEEEMKKENNGQIDQAEVKKEPEENEECSIARQGYEVKVESEPYLREIPENIRSMGCLPKLSSLQTGLTHTYPFSFPYLFPSYPYFLPPQE